MIDFAQYTNAGSREINEDYITSAKKDNSYIFVLADGLGGHGRGEEASELVSEEILNCFRAWDNFADNMGQAIEYAQQKLLEKQRENFARFEMKTTLVVLFISDNVIRWGHIGDSRLYLMKKHKIKKRTMDHSVPQMLALAKDIKEKDIRFHPDRNKLLRVMGIEWGGHSYELSDTMKVKNKLSFLLCTDGFWELITESEIEKTHKNTDGAIEWINKMVSIVENNGKDKDMDNFSAIAVRITDR